MANFLLYLVVSLFIFVALMLILLVLIQKGRGGGLASAFGGGAGGHTAFGSKTGDVLTWATAIVFGVFLVLAIVANLVFNKSNSAAIPAGMIAPTPVQQRTPNRGSTSPGTPSDPSGPGQPGSSLPQAPVTADPGVQNPPAGPQTPPTTQPK